MNISKLVLPVVAGSMVGMILVTLIETRIKMSLSTAGLPEIGSGQLPDNAFMFLLVNYMVCSLVAGIIASLVAGRITAIPAMVVGIVLTLAGLYNVAHMHHPVWFTIANLVAYLPFSYAGYLISRKKATIPA